MNHSCKYHPGTPALWFCPHDGVYLCQQCVAGEHGNLSEANCLLCDNALECADADEQPPFSQALDRAFGQLLSPVFLGVMAIWAVVAAVVPPVPALLIVAVFGGLPLQRVVSESIALQGRPARRAGKNAPQWACLGDFSGWPITVLQMVPLWLGMAATAGLMLLESPLAAVLVGGVMMALVPALWLAQQVQGAHPRSYTHALFILLSSAKDYALLAGVAALGWMLVVAVSMIAVDLLPAFLAQAATALTAGYWCALLGVLTGALLARYAREWDVDVIGVRRVTEPEAIRRKKTQLRAGRFDVALKAVQRVVNGKKSTVDDWRLYDRLLGIMGKDADRAAMGPVYLDKLIHAEQWRDVQAVIDRLQQQEAGWLPSDAGLRLVIAKGLWQQNPKLAVNLLKDLHQSSPEFSGLGEAYILLATVLHEKFQLTGKADQYLKFVEKQCREAKLRQQVSTLREQWAEGV